MPGSVRPCWVGTARYHRPLGRTAEVKWRALAKGLGVPLTVIAFSAGGPPRSFTQHARFILMPQARLSVLRYLTVFILQPILALWQVMARGANVLIAQSPFDGASAALVKRIAGLLGQRVVLIVENHGDFEESVFMQRRVSFAFAYRWLMRRLARYAFRHADLLRTISSMTDGQVRRWYHGQPIEQFMTWTDAGAFREAERPAPLPDSWDVVYAGVLIPRKGVHTLLDAFARLAPDYPSSHLWIVGKAENEQYAAELEAQTAALGLADRVTFTGGVPQAELASYMARGRVLVVPSISEGLGRVVVEAMMTGTPVIGSAVGGIPDMIRDGKNGLLIPPEDAGALYDALHRMFADPDIGAMGRAAEAFADESFSPEDYVGGYRRLLMRAAGLLAGEG